MSGRRVVMAALLAVSLGGCGSGGDGEGDDGLEDPDATVAVEGSAFVPDRVSLKAGGIVRWEFKDAFEHTVTADDGTFDSKPTKSPNFFEFVPGSPGTFTYKCTIHPSMKGTVTAS